MSYFLIDTPLTLNTPTTLLGDEARHLLLSRRVKVGELIEVQDPTPARFVCTITKIQKREVIFQPQTLLTLPTEPYTKLVIHQALIAEQALDLVIQKATELGVAKLLVFPAERSPGKLLTSKLPRWQRISLEAAKQSGRVAPMHIKIDTYAGAVARSLPRTPTFYLSQHATGTLSHKLQTVKSNSALVLWIGPEGGWSQAEETDFAQNEITALLLGPYTLRAETATLAAATLVLCA